jgi:6-phosphofructokinase 1
MVIASKDGDPIRLGGIGAKLAHDLEPLIKHEVRSVALGHIQRGGETSAADRVLSVRYGVAAAELIGKGLYGTMVCLRGGEMSYVNLNEVIGNAKVAENRLVDPEGEMVRVARSLGVSFGD